MNSIGVVYKKGVPKQAELNVTVRKCMFKGEYFRTICISDEKGTAIEARLTDEIIKELKGVIK